MKISIILGGSDSNLAYPQGHTIADFLKPFGVNGEKARAVYDPQNTSNVNVKDVGNKIARDRGQLEPARFIARMLSSQGQTVYEFRFSCVAKFTRKQGLGGAPHASEVPYVFETLHQRYGSQATAVDAAMARTVSSYWTAFAKTGDPNGVGRPHWPAYNLTQDLLTNFINKGIVIEPDPWKLRLDLTEQSHHSD